MRNRLFNKYSLSSPIGITDNNPLGELIKDFPEVQSIIKKEIPDNVKLIYINKKKIDNILYESEKMINLDSILTNNNVSNSLYFFINLLLKDNENVVNYEYSFDSIKSFNNIINNNKNNIFIDIVGSKLIIDLIENYKQLDDYDEE